MYVERWLKVSIRLPDGDVMERDKGTPQGGVISPLLANMFLHVVFDAWMEKHYANTKYGTIRWERYADDIIVHCKNDTEARYIRNRIRERLVACKLELHPDKPKIVYCKQSNRRGKYDKHISFDFLGFTFRPDRMYRRNEDGKGSLWVGLCGKYTPQSDEALGTTDHEVENSPGDWGGAGGNYLPEGCHNSGLDLLLWSFSSLLYAAGIPCAQCQINSLGNE